MVAPEHRKISDTPKEWKPAFWIFQAKPDRYDLTEGRRLEPGHVTRWLVSRYEQEIRKGGKGDRSIFRNRAAACPAVGARSVAR